MARAFIRHLTVVIAFGFVFQTGSAAMTGLARFDGRPVFSEGNALGYFIWKDGNTWKMRWTTFGAQHRFTGRIVAEGGQLTSMKRIDVDAERRVLVPGRAPRVVVGPRGRVRGVTGGRAPVVAERVEDVIVQDDERLIRFNTLTDNDLDGLEFKANENVRELRFFLTIDGAPRPAVVRVGRENFQPEENPVVVSLR